jgi:hypothetical protein
VENEIRFFSSSGINPDLLFYIFPGHPRFNQKSSYFRVDQFHFFARDKFGRVEKGNSNKGFPLQESTGPPAEKVILPLGKPVGGPPAKDFNRLIGEYPGRVFNGCIPIFGGCQRKEEPLLMMPERLKF